MAFHGTVTGNLGSDPDLKFNQAGKATLALSIAATPSRLDRQSQQWQDIGDPLWIRATLWEQTAERLADHLHKGDRVSIEGTLSIRSYQAQDGTQRLSYDLIGAKFLGVIPRAPQGAQQATSPAHGYSGGSTTGGPQNGSYATSGGFDDNPPF